MFIKWPSIENSYREKFIDKAVEEHPDLAICTYEVTEKLHGSNVQFHFEPGEEMRVATRNRYLEPGSKFYSIWDVLPEYQRMWDEINAYSNRHSCSLRLFGELYGQGVQKGVDYGPKKRISFFGVMVDSELISPSFLAGFAMIAKVEEWLVPRVELIEGLQAALDVDTNFPTIINPIEGNICEGVVIQPYHRVYRLSNGSTFLLKKKNEAFKEKQKARKPPPYPIDSETLRLRAVFEEYINNSRIQSVFSQWGCIEEPRQIGEYIRLVIADALEDFLKDHKAAWNVATKQQQGQITKVGATVAGMLKRYL